MQLHSIFIVFCLLVANIAMAQDFKWLQKDNKKDPLIMVEVRKSGPYFGLQQGAYTFAELGGEIQWKRKSIREAKTHAVNFGGEYNLTHNVLGFNAGAWRKPGRYDFTYGLNAVYRSNFDEHKIGIGPNLGYKIFGFHLQTGYVFHTNARHFVEHNELYISLRFLMVTERERTIHIRKKEKK